MAAMPSQLDVLPRIEQSIRSLAGARGFLREAAAAEALPRSNLLATRL